MYVDCGPALLFLIEYIHNSNSRFGVKCIGEEEDKEKEYELKLEQRIGDGSRAHDMRILQGRCCLHLQPCIRRCGRTCYSLKKLF